MREEVLEQCGYSTRAVQIRHVVPPRRLEIREVGRAICYGLEVVYREVDIRCAGHSQEMQDLSFGEVGGPAEVAGVRGRAGAAAGFRQVRTRKKPSLAASLAPPR